MKWGGGGGGAGGGDIEWLDFQDALTHVHSHTLSCYLTYTKSVPRLNLLKQNYEDQSSVIIQIIGLYWIIGLNEVHSQGKQLQSFCSP